MFVRFAASRRIRVAKVIAGPGVYICDECVRLCSDIIDDEGEQGDLPEQDSTSEGSPRVGGYAMSERVEALVERAAVQEDPDSWPPGGTSIVLRDLAG